MDVGKKKIWQFNVEKKIRTVLLLSQAQKKE